MSDPMLEYARERIAKATDLDDLKNAILEWFDHVHPEVMAAPPEPVPGYLPADYDTIQKVRQGTGCRYETAERVLKAGCLDLETAIERVKGWQRHHGYRT